MTLVKSPWPEIGTPLAQVLSPMPIIDEARLAANITRAQAYVQAQGKTFRPHIKTHKVSAVAQQQLAAGAVGINCQKVTEAEAFAAAGFDDILITYNVLGPQRLSRLLQLNNQVSNLRVVADSPAIVAGLAKRFEGQSKPLRVLVECDVGAGRCGVQTPAQAVALARQIAASGALQFEGLMTYPPAGGAAQVETFFQGSMRQLSALGISCPVRSNGGSPDLFSAGAVASATEHRAGTYVYNDRSMVRAGSCSVDEIAMHVLATVVSRPTAVRAVLDAGSKALTSDLLGFTDHGELVGLPGARITSLSEEHGVVDLSDCTVPLPDVGAQVRIIPNHACVISNLFDRMVFHKNGIVSRVETVSARGLVW